MAKLSENEKKDRAAKRAETLRLKADKEEADRMVRLMESRLRDIRTYLINEPTVHFKAGDSVSIGNLTDCVVVEVLDSGKVLKVENAEVDNRGNKTGRKNVQYWAWHDAQLIKAEPTEQFRKPIRFPISFNNTHLSSITNMYYRGVQTEIDYQRPYVWTEDDRVQLIESIFNNVEIGKFAFVELPFDADSPFQWEILDGKQRLLTLVAFLEGRFKYRGKTFFDLSSRDQHHIRDFNCTMGIARELNASSKYEYFLRLNTFGRPQSEEHMNHVRELLRKESEKK